MKTIFTVAIFVGLTGACRTQHEEAEHAHEAHAGKTEHEEDLISLTAEAMQSASLELAVAEKKPLQTGVRASAVLALPQEQQAQITSRVPGRITAIRVKLGQNVNKGDALAVVESPELGEARASYLAALTKLHVAETNYQREKELVEKGISAARELREAEAARAAAEADVDAGDAKLHAFGLSETDIKALKATEHYTSEFPLRTPIAGRVIEIKTTVGQAVEGTALLFTVGETKELWALLDIFEGQLPFVRAGQEVELAVNAVPDTRFRGRLDYIGEVVEESTRTIHVRVVVPNGDGRLKPGMFASAEIASAAGGETSVAVIVVPREAVQRVEGRDLVFVPVGELREGKFKAVPVTVGKTSITEAQIDRGLEAGTKVVVRGAFVLKSELSKESMGEGHSH